MKSRKPNQKRFDGKVLQTSTLATRDEILQLSTIDQIALIEELAAKITANPQDHVR